MSKPGEIDIDPTTTTEGEGAKGGAVGGDSEGDTTFPPPLQPPPDIDRTNPFEPTGGTLTPYSPPEDDRDALELSNVDPDYDEFDPDDIPLLTDFLSEEDNSTVLDKTLQFIKDKYKKS